LLIIGELLNATRKNVRQAIIKREKSIIQDLAHKQEECGADYIDLNVATGTGDQENEIAYMRWVIEVIREVTNIPLSIDTANYDVLSEALTIHGPGAMINSISAEKERLFPFLKLARKYDCSVLVLPIKDSGIPRYSKTRLQISNEILQAAVQEGIPKERLYFDPLCLPIGVEENNGIETLNTLQKMKEQLGLKTTLGLSNISYGLPLRPLINRTFLSLAILKGLDSVILNPLDKEVMSTMRATLLCLGKDSFCSAYLQAFRNGVLVK